MNRIAIPFLAIVIMVQSVLIVYVAADAQAYKELTEGYKQRAITLTLDLMACHARHSCAVRPNGGY